MADDGTEDCGVADSPRGAERVGGGGTSVTGEPVHTFGADGEGAAAIVAPGEVAKIVMEKIAAGLRERGIVVEEGRFGAMMSVASVNEGPVTLLVEC